jgi:hypothetical protein
LLCCLIATLDAEVIDRIVAVVDGRLVTLSDLRRERENRTRLGESNIPDEKELTKQLVDSHLIEIQAADYPNIEASVEEIDAELARLKLGTGPSANSLRETIARRLRFQKFFEVKFGSSILPTEEEVRQYYEDVFAPEARRRGLQPIPPLSDAAIAAAIRNNVMQEKLDRELELWLASVRLKSNVEIFQ